MWNEFRAFLLKQNALALAVGVVTGAAFGRVVTSVVGDLMMPVFSLVMPGGEWRAAKIVLGRTAGPDGREVVNAINYGNFLGTVVDFVIVSFVVFLIIQQLLKPSPAAPAKTCPFCRETVPAEATRCRACTSAL